MFVAVDVGDLPTPRNPLDVLPKAINPNAGRGFTNTLIATFINYSLGANYYFMPENIYLVLEFAIANADFARGNKHYSRADYGFGLQTSIGKEWWMSKNWGLGLALNLSYDYFPKTRMGDPIITPLHMFMVGISLSATYN